MPTPGQGFANIGRSIGAALQRRYERERREQETAEAKRMAEENRQRNETEKAVRSLIATLTREAHAFDPGTLAQIMKPSGVSGFGTSPIPSAGELPGFGAARVQAGGLRTGIQMPRVPPAREFDVPAPEDVNQVLMRLGEALSGAGVREREAKAVEKESKARKAARTEARTIDTAERAEERLEMERGRYGWAEADRARKLGEDKTRTELLALRNAELRTIEAYGKEVKAAIGREQPVIPKDASAKERKEAEQKQLKEIFGPGYVSAKERYMLPEDIEAAKTRIQDAWREMEEVGMARIRKFSGETPQEYIQRLMPLLGDKALEWALDHEFKQR